MKKYLIIASLVLIAAACNKTPAGNQSSEQNSNSNDPTAAWQSYHVGGEPFDFKYPADKYKLTTYQNGYNILPNKIIQVSTDSSRFPNTNFGDAAVTVSDKAPMNNEEKCFVGNKNGIGSFDKSETINGTKYYIATGNGAAAGNRYDQKVFRTYRGNCFEIVETIHTSNIGNYPPGSGIKEIDKNQIWAELDQIVHTFKLATNP